MQYDFSVLACVQFSQCCPGGATHSQLVQLVDESADRCRHRAVSSCAVLVDADNLSPAAGVPRRSATVSAGRSAASVPGKPNTATSRRWSVLTSVAPSTARLVLD